MDLKVSLLSTSRVDVSVVVSTCNRRESLARTLDGLVSQVMPTSSTFEILVVDNNSTDGTRELVAEYTRRHPGLVRYLFEGRQGVSFGRNAGIHAARGPIIAFTDDDNTVPRTWVATIMTLMAGHPEVAGVGGKVLPEWPSTPPSWLDRRHWSPLAILDYGEHPFHTSSARPRCLITANLAVRRAVLTESGGFSPRYYRCQDHDLQLRLWRAGHRLLYAPELVAFAPIDPRRLTRSYHRHWHRQHGHYGALLALEEAVDSTGALRPGQHDTPRLLGAPGYVYRALGSHARQWMRARLRRQEALAIHHEHRVWYLASYIRHTASLSRDARRPIVADAGAFASRHLARRAAGVGMSTRRFLAAHAVVALLVGGSAWDTLTGTEHWPFSPYPMFSRVERERTLDSLVIRGVGADGGERELSIRDGAMLGPFDQCRITTAMQRVAAGDEPRLATMLGDTLARYESARERGAHDGPPLRALRVYQAHWSLSPDASNVEAPDQMRLLSEAVRPLQARVAGVR